MTYLLVVILLLLVTSLAGCGVDLANPPRLATATARAAATATSPPPPLVLAAPTATPSADEPLPSGDPTAAPNSASTPLKPARLTVWVNETSPEHRQVLDELAAEFADSRGIDVAIQLVSPSLLPELVSTGILSGTLPDIVVHPVEFTAGWVEGGILDPAAADEVVERLGRESFDPSALELVTISGQAAAIPSDGFHQLILYRADWYEERGLRAPDTFTAMQTAAEAIFDPEAIISGLVIPTESNLITTHQAFEQMALANGCRLIDEAGEVKILEPACHEAIEHYYTTINRFSPSGVQTDTSARNALLEGRTGLIMTSPAILPDLAGLNPAAMPSCPECETDENGINYLADNTGILTELRGPGGDPTAFGNVTLLGITTTADREAAQAFAEFWFNEGYERWLGVNSERKVPMRLGTVDDPRGFIDNWGLAPLGESGMSLTDIYGAEVVARLRDGIAAAPRWGLREGYGALMTRLYDDLIISIVLQEMLSGYFGTDTTLNEAYRRTVDLIPNYSFPFLLDEEELAP
jgi:multiple sugar transport system substrate-binding protein